MKRVALIAALTIALGGGGAVLIAQSSSAENELREHLMTVSDRLMAGDQG